MWAQPKSLLQLELQSHFIVVFQGSQQIIGRAWTISRSPHISPRHPIHYATMPDEWFSQSLPPSGQCKQGCKGQRAPKV